MLFASFEIKTKKKRRPKQYTAPLPFTLCAPSSQVITYTQNATFTALDEDTYHLQKDTKVKQHTKIQGATPSKYIIKTRVQTPDGAIRYKSSGRESQGKADQTSPIPTFRHLQLFIEIPQQVAASRLCVALGVGMKRGLRNKKREKKGCAYSDIYEAIFSIQEEKGRKKEGKLPIPLQG